MIDFHFSCNQKYIVLKKIVIRCICCELELKKVETVLNLRFNISPKNVSDETSDRHLDSKARKANNGSPRHIQF